MQIILSIQRSHSQRYRGKARTSTGEEGRTLEAIERETDTLAKVRGAPDIIINTTRLNVHQLKQILRLEGDIVSRKFQIIITFRLQIRHASRSGLPLICVFFRILIMCRVSTRRATMKKRGYFQRLHIGMFELMKDLFELCAE